MALSRPILPEARRPALARALARGAPVRALECHNPLSALVAAAARGAEGEAFDALWVSGFSHATALGLPDAELAWLERRLDALSDIAAVCDLPLIVDGDTGGDALAFSRLCLRLESLGVSAVVVEDKAGAKRTSLAEGVAHELEATEAFLRKIAVAKETMLSGETLIFARTEALIAGAGVAEALARLEAFLQGPADGVVVHSKDKSGADVLAVLDGYATLQAQLGVRKPLMLIPTAYNHLTGAELARRGASVVVYGNHLIRAAYQGMRTAAASILDHDRSLEADSVCASVNDLLDAVGVDLATATRR